MERLYDFGLPSGPTSNLSDHLKTTAKSAGKGVNENNSAINATNKTIAENTAAQGKKEAEVKGDTDKKAEKEKVMKDLDEQISTLTTKKTTLETTLTETTTEITGLKEQQSQEREVMHTKELAYNTSRGSLYQARAAYAEAVRDTALIKETVDANGNKQKDQSAYLSKIREARAVLNAAVTASMTALREFNAAKLTHAQTSQKLEDKVALKRGFEQQLKELAIQLKKNTDLKENTETEVAKLQELIAKNKEVIEGINKLITVAENTKKQHQQLAEIYAKRKDVAEKAIARLEKSLTVPDIAANPTSEELEQIQKYEFDLNATDRVDKTYIASLYPHGGDAAVESASLYKQDDIDQLESFLHELSRSHTSITRVLALRSSEGPMQNDNVKNYLQGLEEGSEVSTAITTMKKEEEKHELEQEDFAAEAYLEALLAAKSHKIHDNLNAIVRTTVPELGTVTWDLRTNTFYNGISGEPFEATDDVKALLCVALRKQKAKTNLQSSLLYEHWDKFNRGHRVDERLNAMKNTADGKAMQEQIDDIQRLIIEHNNTLTPEDYQKNLKDYEAALKNLTNLVTVDQSDSSNMTIPMFTVDGKTYEDFTKTLLLPESNTDTNSENKTPLEMVRGIEETKEGQKHETIDLQQQTVEGVFGDSKAIIKDGYIYIPSVDFQRESAPVLMKTEKGEVAENEVPQAVPRSEIGTENQLDSAIEKYVPYAIDGVTKIEFVESSDLSDTYKDIILHYADTNKTTRFRYEVARG